MSDLSDLTLIRLRFEAIHLGREIAGIEASWEEALHALRQFVDEFLEHLEEMRREDATETSLFEIPIED